MKNLVLGVLLALGATSAFAQDLSLSGDVSVGSRYIYRGLELNNDATYGAEGKLDNILVPGLYVSGQVNTLSTTPVNSTTTRSDVGAGFHNSLGLDGFDADFSVHRVYDPSIYASTFYRTPHLVSVNPTTHSVTVNVGDVKSNTLQDDYTEARAKLSYNVGGVATVYGEVDQVVSTGFSRNTYAAAGVETKALLPQLTVGALVSGEHYRDAGVTRYNNSEVYASYNVWKGLSAEARYSFGGKFVDNTNIDNYSYVGVRYSF